MIRNFTIATTLFLIRFHYKCAFVGFSAVSHDKRLQMIFPISAPFLGKLASWRMGISCPTACQRTLGPKYCEIAIFYRWITAECDKCGCVSEKFQFVVCVLAFKTKSILHTPECDCHVMTKGGSEWIDSQKQWMYANLYGLQKMVSAKNNFINASHTEISSGNCTSITVLRITWRDNHLTYCDRLGNGPRLIYIRLTERFFHVSVQISLFPHHSPSPSLHPFKKNRSEIFWPAGSFKTLIADKSKAFRAEQLCGCVRIKVMGLMIERRIMGVVLRNWRVKVVDVPDREGVGGSRGSQTQVISHRMIYNWGVICVISDWQIGWQIKSSIEGPFYWSQEQSQCVLRTTW